MTISFSVPPKAILVDDPSEESQLSHPGGQWLPGAYVNPARNCLSLGHKRNSDDIAVIWRNEGDNETPVNTMTFEKLQSEVWLVAYALETLGLEKGSAIAIDMPMDVNSVVIYLAIVLAGYVVVSIADSFAPGEISTRLVLSKAKAIFTQQSRQGSDCSTEECSTSGFGYDYWVGNLEGVDSRRDKFLRFMGLNSKWLTKREEEEECEEDFIDEIQDTIKILPQNSDFQDWVLYRQPSLSVWSSSTNEHLGFKTVNWDESEDIKTSFDFQADGLIENKPNLGSKEGQPVTLLDRRKKVKKGWLQKLNVMARITDKYDESLTLKPNLTNSKGSVCTHSVNVHTHKKKSKELSSLYATQDFPAHNGPISIIKFSHDGRYLASAGEDGIVRVWEIFEDQDPRIYEIQETDPSSFYFSTNHLSELAPINKEKSRKIKGFRKSSELACVILPPKVFRIL